MSKMKMIMGKSIITTGNKGEGRNKNGHRVERPLDFRV